jgi:hypothetical protein
VSPGIEAYLREYRKELARRRVLSFLGRRRVIAEARQHLAESAKALVGEGHPAASAEELAIRRFGAPGELARGWLSAEDPIGPGAVSSWLLLTPLGLVAGVALTLVLGDLVGALVGMMLVVPLAGLVIGGGLGAGQWLSVRGLLTPPLRWIAATAAGVSCGLTAASWAVEGLGFVKGNRLHEGAALAIIGAATGLGVASLQQLFARRPPGGALAWLGRMALGMGAGAALVALSLGGTPGSFRSPSGLLLLALAAGTAAAALTAPVLRRAG